jgi:hypothetical protein
MFPTKLLSIVALVTLPVSAAAQFTFPQFKIPQFPGTFTRVLPPSELRSGYHDLTYGDSVVGGIVHAYAGMARQRQGSYEMGDVAFELSASGKFLGRRAEVVDISGFGSNVINNGVQTRSGQFRYEILGATISPSFQGSFTLPPDTAVFSLFPQDVTNFSCGFGIDAGCQLPTGQADVSLIANADCFAFISAGGTISIGSTSGMCSIVGKVVNNQKLNVNATASAVSGLSGSGAYAMGRNSVTMLAFSVTNSISLWSSAAVSKSLM